MTNNNIIILTSEFPPGPGGIGNHAYNLAKWLTIHGKNVEVWTSSTPGFATEEINFDQEQSFAVSRYEKRNGIFKTYSNLLRKLKSRIDDSDSIEFIASGMVSLLIGGFLKIFTIKLNKFFAIVHGLDINLSNLFLRQMVKLSLTKYDKIVAVSNYTATYISPDLKNKTVVINNGVDIDKFIFSDTNSSVSHDNRVKGYPSLISVGTVWERKGQLNVIRALPHILKHFPQAHYHIVGKPTEITQVLELAKSLKVDENIIIHGLVSDEHLKGLLSGSDIFIMLSAHTSNGDFEGFGIAILEANSLGIPAIGSKNCGIEDAILDDQTGKLVDPLDASQITNAINDILNNLSEYSVNAKEHASTCSWQNVIKKYLLILNN